MNSSVQLMKSFASCLCRAAINSLAILRNKIEQNKEINLHPNICIFYLFDCHNQINKICKLETKTINNNNNKQTIQNKQEKRIVLCLSLVLL